MSILIKKPPIPPKVHYYKGDMFYTTRVHIYNKNIEVGIVKGRSDNFNILNRTEEYSKECLKTLNSNKLNYKPEFYCENVEFTVHFGTCLPYMMYCDYIKDVCNYNFDD